MKKYLWMSSAAVVIGSLRVKMVFQIPKDDPYPDDAWKKKLEEPKEPGTETWAVVKKI